MAGNNVSPPGNSMTNLMSKLNSFMPTANGVNGVPAPATGGRRRRRKSKKGSKKAGRKTRRHRKKKMMGFNIF